MEQFSVLSPSELKKQVFETLSPDQKQEKLEEEACLEKDLHRIIERIKQIEKRPFVDKQLVCRIRKYGCIWSSDPNHKPLVASSGMVTLQNAGYKIVQTKEGEFVVYW